MSVERVSVPRDVSPTPALLGIRWKSLEIHGHGKAEKARDGGNA